MRKQYKFKDGEGFLSVMGVKASSFESAKRIAKLFMDNPACIGWGPCRD